MRLVPLCGVLVLTVAAPASLPAQDTRTPAACAGLTADSAEAAILGCFRPATPPSPVLPDSEPAPESVLRAPEPVPDTLGASPPAAAPEPPGDAAIADPEPPQAPPARDDELARVFADWLRRHPIGSAVDPTEARLLVAEDRPLGLPALPSDRSYAEVDGMIVELDPGSGELLRLVRRAPVLAEVPQQPAPDVSRDDGNTSREQAERQAEQEREEREQEAAERAAEEAVREAAERAREGREREEEQAREAAERDAEEREREVDRAREEDRAENRGEEPLAPDVPKGHMPPPGSCRVWFPDRPPGQQPPPTSCDTEVPPGAVLIRG